MPPLVVGGVVLGVAALAAVWVAVERRAASPMVELRMLTAPALWSAALITAAVAAISSVLQTSVPKMFEVSGTGYGFALGTSEDRAAHAAGQHGIAGVVAGSVGGWRGDTDLGPWWQPAPAHAVICSPCAAYDEAWQLVVLRAVVAFAGSLITTALLASTATAVAAAADTGIVTSLLVVIRRSEPSSARLKLAGSVLTVGIDPVSEFQAGEPAGGPSSR